MDNNESAQSVKVAVHIRPLVTQELLLGCTDCITVFPNENQVQIGSHAFTFDCVFGNKGLPSLRIFDDCVSPLVDALFHGYNGTVLAYGQTGSGKTYTMGTNYNGEDHKHGVIPKVIDAIFAKVEAMKESTEFHIRVSFIEIFKEEVFDLLDPHPATHLRNEATSMAKTTGLARAPIQIRETVSGGITLAGVTDAEVRTKEEMASYLLQGSLARATGSTNMNSQSSRSHAIFTIAVEQRRMNHLSTSCDVGDDILIAKLHLVDLAGSERAKRTGADGMRLQEGIHINKGLLSLGNVISALGDDKKRKEGGHVPYRDSKLTRILQDSLGGNSKTIMIACVSPADTNAEETLNTLKYANRARNIQNKAIINRDPANAQMQRMRSQIEQLQAELLYFRGESNLPSEEIKILKHKISLLEQSKMELQEELQECRSGYAHLTQCAIDAQVERDRLILKIESIQNGKQLAEIDSEEEKDIGIVRSYITKIQELEAEVLRLQNSNRSRHDVYANYFASEDDGTHAAHSYLMDATAIENIDEAEDVEKELEYSSIQEKFDNELRELNKALEKKEAEMKRFDCGDTSILKQHYEKKVQDLEIEKMRLQKEIEELTKNLSCISTHSGDSAQRVKEEYLQKLNILEKQVSELKKKQDAQAQMLRQKQKSDEAAKRLQDEIHRIKTQKVQLQQKIKQESEQFRQWKVSREKEVLQLKKEGRRNEYEMHKLLSLNQRQKQVLHRKTEEAAAATRRLKELLDSRKASREGTGAGNNKGLVLEALVQAIEHELEVTVRVHEVRSEYERQMKERSKMAEEVAKLKEEVLIEKPNSSRKFPHAMSPGARNSRIYALENMLATSSSTLVSMAAQLSEAEERERAFSGRGRWNQVRSLPEAKNIMNCLFNLASSARCQLRDKEFDCREMDSEIRDLKEKVVNLVRQLQVQRAELLRVENAMSAMTKHSKEMKDGLKTWSSNNTERRTNSLQLKGDRNSDDDYDEDMDTSDDEDYEAEEESLYLYNDNDSEFECTKDRKRGRNRMNSKGKNNLEADIDSEKPTTVTSSSGIRICCSCSKSSFCKTSRCECRAAGGGCCLSCSCEITKCSNREGASANLVLPELASHGAMLLESALAEKPNNSNNDTATRRRPLSDIGNNLARSNAAVNTMGRKKWRKSVIQLVPAVEPEVQVNEIPKNNDGNGEIIIPSKIPRPARSTLPNNNQLKDRNSDRTTEPPIDKDSIPSSVGSPGQQAKAKLGKENKGL